MADQLVGSLQCSGIGPNGTRGFAAQCPDRSGLGQQARQSGVQQKSKPQQEAANTHRQQRTMGTWWINGIRCVVGRGDVGLLALRRNGCVSWACFPPSHDVVDSGAFVIPGRG